MYAVPVLNIIIGNKGLEDLLENRKMLIIISDLEKMRSLYSSHYPFLSSFCNLSTVKPALIPRMR